jgi:hypothetical protein
MGVGALNVPACRLGTEAQPSLTIIMPKMLHRGSSEIGGPKSWRHRSCLACCIPSSARVGHSGWALLWDVVQVLAILHLLGSFRRVLYVDIDIHHGDAVQVTPLQLKHRSAENPKPPNPKELPFLTSYFAVWAAACNWRL